MKTFADLFSHLTSIALLVFLFQIPIFDLSDWGISILYKIQNSKYNYVFFAATKFISYHVLYSLVGLFFMHIVVIKPIFVETNNFVFFFCCSITVNCWLKILFGETRPYMYALLSHKLDIRNIGCETDFGMPSGHLFIATALYYMARVRYFVTDVSKQHIFSNKSHNCIETYCFKSETIKLRAEQRLRYYLFNFLSIFGFITLSISRYVAGAHFLPQVLFGFIFGFVWSHLYFKYISVTIRRFLYNLATRKGDVDSYVAHFWVIYIYGCLIALALAICKLYLNNTVEFSLLEEYLLKACGPGLHLGLRNFQDSFLAVIPLFILVFHRTIGAGSQTQISCKKTFQNLTRTQQLLRLFIILTPPALIATINIRIKHHYRNNTIKSTYFIISLASMICCCVLIAFCYSILQPLFLYRFGLLLKGELINENDKTASLVIEMNRCGDFCGEIYHLNNPQANRLLNANNSDEDIEMRELKI